MSTSRNDRAATRPERIRVDDGYLRVWLRDGRILAVPLTWYPRLCDGTDRERNNWKPIGDNRGIHWPDLDEHISVDGLLNGRPCNHSMKSLGRWLLARRAGRGVTDYEIREHEEARHAEKLAAFYKSSRANSKATTP